MQRMMGQGGMPGMTGGLAGQEMPEGGAGPSMTGSASDESVAAEIVTVDGSLVQRLAFNRYPGLVRQVVE